MSTQFAPVELATIKQGEFLSISEESFKQLQQEFIGYVEENKVSADAELSMKVKLRYDKQKEAYAIVTQIEKKLPKMPATVTSAFADSDSAGEKTLWAQAAGTTDGNPRQMKLCKDNGEAVDLETGK